MSDGKELIRQSDATQQVTESKVGFFWPPPCHLPSPPPVLFHSPTPLPSPHRGKRYILGILVNLCIPRSRNCLVGLVERRIIIPPPTTRDNHPFLPANLAWFIFFLFFFFPFFSKVPPIFPFPPLLFLHEPMIRSQGGSRRLNDFGQRFSRVRGPIIRPTHLSYSSYRRPLFSFLKWIEYHADPRDQVSLPRSSSIFCQTMITEAPRVFSFLSSRNKEGRDVTDVSSDRCIRREFALQLSDVADPNLSNSYLESVSRAVEEAGRVWGGGRRLSRTLKGRKCLERRRR